ncbi:mobilome CxxCx(11)CxxC protein [Vibrio cholerae]|uniref:mobilome CxxCx(11)CxxC protein n=1 Tax=Vibrio cholerae TaxID=666 RepID=UPI0018F09628|nr:mobilome CxxCx(11)CxxC protein [Vibrio cholerae]EGQ7759996.1 hypothetical protein [Vibrio vulnificus]EGR4362693.1 hypothetical protein [Vibrio cholerae]EJB5285423.1 hypothetical protein [Vibrio vulnificus]EKD9069049.1 hypothetical protein [Vibrio vulnificus]MBJ6953944.1 hypothetical protein [Vibrio cholerae]
MSKNIVDMRFHSFGTMKIFERRRRVYSGLRNLITYMGFLVPLLIGGIALSFDSSSEIFKNIIIPVASGVMIFQMCISLWSAIEGWDSKHEYSVGSIRSNNSLYLKLNSICTNQRDLTKLELQQLENDYSRQDADDSSHGLSKNEIRYGYRCSLMNFSQTCPTCGEKPHKMKPTDCDICGNFPRRYNW